MPVERKAATLTIDLGLNAGLGVELGPDYPLQHGLVHVDPALGDGRGHPAWYTHFIQGDELTFRLWDITTIEPVHGRNFRIVSFEARFVEPADPKILKNPFGSDESNPITFDSNSIRRVTDPNAIGTSVYPKTQDAWVLGSGPPLGSRFQLRTKGTYLLSMTVQVELIESNSLRTYNVDPEAVIGEGEIPDPPG